MVAPPFAIFQQRNFTTRTWRNDDIPANFVEVGYIQTEDSVDTEAGYLWSDAVA